MGGTVFIKVNARHEGRGPALHTRYRGQAWGGGPPVSRLLLVQFLWVSGLFLSTGWVIVSQYVLSLRRVQMGLFWDEALWAGTGVMLRAGWPLLLLTASPTTGLLLQEWSGQEREVKERGFKHSWPSWPFLTPFYLICTCSPRKPLPLPTPPNTQGKNPATIYWTEFWGL